MPLLIAQEHLADGLRLTVSGGAAPIVITSADLPANIKSGTAAACETWVNNRLATLLTGRDFSALVRVHSVVPLVVDLATGPVGMSTFPARG